MLTSISGTVLLLDDVFQAVLPAGHRLARRRRPLELAELSGELWIGGAPTSAWYRIASDSCRRVGFGPAVVAMIDSLRHASRALADSSTNSSTTVPEG
jgi:DNA-binding transcriptional LysR family regulator